MSFFLILLLLLLVFYKLVFKKELDKNLVKDNFYTIESRIDNIKNTSIEGTKTLGWLRVQGTNIDLPILELIDEVEDEHKLNYAWLSNFYFEGDNRKVIYGHNIRNVSSNPIILDSSHTRFEQLPSFTDYDFAKDNLYIQLTENGEDKLYKIYAIGFYSYEEDRGDSYITENLDKFIKEAKENSIYDYDVDVDKNDEVISLMTCTRYFGKYEKNQIRIDARRLRKNEKINQYSVATTSFYDIMK